MIVVCTTVQERADRWAALAQTFPGLVLCVDEPRPRGRVGSCCPNDARALRVGATLTRGRGYFLRVQDDIHAPADLHAHLDALAEALPQDALMVSLHSNLGDDAAWAGKHGPARPLPASASYLSSHAALVRAAYAYDLANDQERADPERHNDVRYLWTAKRLDLRLYTLIPSLVQHDNLPSLLGNPQAPASIPRSSRTYDDARPASEAVAGIIQSLAPRTAHDG